MRRSRFDFVVQAWSRRSGNNFELPPGAISVFWSPVGHDSETASKIFRFVRRFSAPVGIFSYEVKTTAAAAKLCLLEDLIFVGTTTSEPDDDVVRMTKALEDLKKELLAGSARSTIEAVATSFVGTVAGLGKVQDNECQRLGPEVLSSVRFCLL